MMRKPISFGLIILTLLFGLSLFPVTPGAAARLDSESFETTATLTFTPGPDLPDLVITSMVLTERYVCYPETRITIYNNGLSDAGSFVVDFNNTQKTVASLQAGQTITLWFSGHMTGINVAFVDSTAQVIESNENNNILTDVLLYPTMMPTCAPSKSPTPTGTLTSLPDLEVTSLQIAQQTSNSCMRGLGVWIKNSGEREAGSFVVEVNGARQTVAGLEAGQSFYLWFPGYDNATNTAIVDVTRLVAESKEYNNTFAVSYAHTLTPAALACTPSPTLTLTPSPSPTATASLTPSQTPTTTPITGYADLRVTGMSITLETGNSCSFTSTSLGVRVWFENIGQQDAGSFVVTVNGARKTVNGLAAGQSASLWFPGYLNGFNSALVDATSVISENSEDNNFLVQLLPVPTLPPTCTPTQPSIKTASFYSIAAQDGWIVEKDETSSLGGAMQSDASVLLVGDHATKKQYRSLVSFRVNLPENAIITEATLKLTKAGNVIGKDPFLAHKPLLIDLAAPQFGTSAWLELLDFNAKSSLNAVGRITREGTSSRYSAKLSAQALQHIVNGFVQFRLRFHLDDNNDNVADYIRFFSGNSTTQSLRPILEIKYLNP